MNTFKNIVLVMVAVTLIAACVGNEDIIVVDPNPTVYVPIPADMKVEGVLQKEYKHNQDIILKADVNDALIIVDENIKWATVIDGIQTPIATGATLHIAGGNLKPGKHAFLVTYSNSQGYGAEFEYRIVVSDPVVRTKINNNTKHAVKWDGYANNNDDTVTHMKTSFTWMIVDDGYDRSFNEAVQYAKNMSSKSGKTWAIPTLAEWKQISDMSKNGYHVVDEPFQGLKSGAKYWTRSAPKDATTVGGKQVAYAMELSSLPGNGQNLRTAAGVVTLDTTCYTILVCK